MTNIKLNFNEEPDWRARYIQIFVFMLFWTGVVVVAFLTVLFNWKDECGQMCSYYNYNAMHIIFPSFSCGCANVKVVGNTTEIEYKSMQEIMSKNMTQACLDIKLVIDKIGEKDFGTWNYTPT